jgi:ABC-type nitrate/sulfonate/bicarbonate transport system permease component
MSGARLTRGAYPRWLGALLPFVLLIVWEYLAATGDLPRYFPRPSVVGRELAAMLASGELFGHIGVSLYRALSGFAVGAAFGIIAGLLAGALRPVERFYEPIISLTYPVPKIAALPIIFAWFGLGDLSKVAIISVTVFYPLYIAAIAGTKSAARVHVWAARNMGASRARIIAQVLFPTALPQIFNGIRIGLALSFVVMFVAELVSSQKGLGFLIVFAELNQRFDMMYVAIVTIGVIGFAADRLVLMLRDRWLVGQLIGTEARA